MVVKSVQPDVIGGERVFLVLNALLYPWDFVDVKTFNLSHKMIS